MRKDDDKNDKEEEKKKSRLVKRWGSSNAYNQ